MSRFIIFLFYPLFLLAFGFFLYAPSLPGEFYFDDGFFLENDLITDLKNIPLFFQGGQTISPMRGISIMTFAVQYQIFGWHAGAFRVFNILIHILNACLVWIIILHLQERAKKLDRKNGDEILDNIDKFFAALAGAIFISHPVLTSGVAYIFQRNGLLCTFFYLTALYALIKAFPIGQSTNRKWVVVFCGAYLLSIWSKETGITFIAVAFIFHWLFRSPTEAQDWRRWFYPLSGVCIFSLAMAFWQMVHIPISKRTVYGNWTVWQNLITQWNVVMKYISLILWPHPDILNLDHDFPIALSIDDNQTWLSGLALIVLLGFGFWCIKKNRLMALGIFWFFITLAVESTIIPINEVMVEYRLYLPAFGFVIAIVCALRLLAKHTDFLKVLSVGSGLILTIFSLFTLQRNAVMKEAFLVWQDCALKSPKSIRSQTAYATYLSKQGRLAEAIPIYRKAVSLNEMGLPFKLPMAQPHNELGVFLLEQGELEKARLQFISALNINRWFAPALENLKVTMEMYDSNTYERAYLKTFEDVDYFPQGHYNLGNHYMRNYRVLKAIAEYEIAVFQKNDFHEAYNNMGTGYVLLNSKKKARLFFERALELVPDFKPAQDNLTALKLENLKSGL
tara:strand:+ start:8980 stop:10842 length:1863 start_codon:yes stop_codon:yes gene_type:complete